MRHLHVNQQTILNDYENSIIDFVKYISTKNLLNNDIGFLTDYFFLLEDMIIDYKIKHEY